MSVNAVGGSTAWTQTVTNTMGNNMGKDQFLKLLITELQNQDPLNAMDNKEFISQMSQFSALEQSVNMNALLTQMMTMQNLTQASSLIGRNVKAQAADGSTLNGTVSQVKMVNGTPMLVIGNVQISLAQVQQVS